MRCEMKKYAMTLQEKGKTVFVALGITILIAVLFYRSVWGCICFPFVFYLVHEKMRMESYNQKKQEMEEQFLHGMRVLNNSLQAGLSMENAWREIEKETLLLYGNKSVFYLEVKDINRSVELSVPIEKLFLDFAYRSELEDAINFAELFHYGKRFGANWKHMIDTVVTHMGEKYEGRKEIEVMVAEKKMEQSIMNILPLGILLFLQVSAWDYMSVLFHNWLGVICMTICLIAYIVSIIISEKILQIRI